MKAFAAAAFTVALVAAPAIAQPPSPPAPTTGVGPVCLHPFSSTQDTINHTHVLDPQHVLFYMRDGKVLLNTLKGPCPGLMIHGFSFVTPEDDCARIRPTYRSSKRMKPACSVLSRHTRQPRRARDASLEGCRSGI